MLIGSDALDGGGAIELEVEVAGTGNFDGGNAGDLCELGLEFGGDGARGLLEALGEFEGDGQRHFAKLDLRRLLDDERGQVNLVALGEESFDLFLDALL